MSYPRAFLFLLGGEGIGKGDSPADLPLKVPYGTSSVEVHMFQLDPRLLGQVSQEFANQAGDPLVLFMLPMLFGLIVGIMVLVTLAYDWAMEAQSKLLETPRLSWTSPEEEEGWEWVESLDKGDESPDEEGSWDPDLGPEWDLPAYQEGLLQQLEEGRVSRPVLQPRTVRRSVLWADYTPAWNAA